jgi:hypothetical protein
MSDPSTWHRIADVDPESKTGSCSQCGPGVPLYFRKSRNHWVCEIKHQGGKRGPHGLTRAEAKEMREGKRCRICGTTENLAVDHCHDSLRIRGVLCRDHNTALGLFDDNVDHLRAAIGYLLETENPLEPL